MAIGDATEDETAWRTGAEGEVRVARALERHLRKHEDVYLFHDRRLRGTAREHRPPRGRSRAASP